MSSPRIFSQDFIRRLAHKPLSLFVVFLSLGMAAYALQQRWQGSDYVARLNYLDVTTLMMLAVLFLRAVTKLNHESDLQTVSIALISSLSFLFAYEAVYKWMFYFLPWRMPPDELREFVIQVGVSLVILTGFAQGIFRITPASKIAMAVFILGMAAWLAVGFPQLWDDARIYAPLFDIPFTHGMIFALNRSTKVALLLFYYLIYV